MNLPVPKFGYKISTVTYRYTMFSLTGTILSLCLLSVVAGSEISFSSTSLTVNPLDWEPLTLVCELKDTTPDGSVSGEKSTQSDVINDDKSKDDETSCDQTVTQT